jgi:hypothetical protein
VSALATAALAGRTGVRYKARDPKFFPNKRVWRVFFEESGPMPSVDGEMLVVVDDRTGHTCTQQAMAVGPCT